MRCGQQLTATSIWSRTSRVLTLTSRVANDGLGRLLSLRHGDKRAAAFPKRRLAKGVDRWPLSCAPVLRSSHNTRGRSRQLGRYDDAQRMEDVDWRVHIWMIFTRCFAACQIRLGSTSVDQLLDAFAEGEALVANTSVTGSSSPVRMQARRRLIPFSSAPASSMVSTFPVTVSRRAFESCTLPRSLWSARGLTAATSSVPAPGLNLLSSRLAGVLIADSVSSLANLSETSIRSVARNLFSRLREAALQKRSTQALRVQAKTTWCAWTCSGTPLKGIV